MRIFKSLLILLRRSLISRKRKKLTKYDLQKFTSTFAILRVKNSRDLAESKRFRILVQYGEVSERNINVLFLSLFQILLRLL